MDCSAKPDPAPDCGVEVDSTIELRFDRYLDPATAVRQSLTVFSGNVDSAVFQEPEYDVLERVLVYRLKPGSTFVSGATYTVQLVVPEKADDSGFRAFDGAPLEAGSVPLEFDFHVRSDATAKAPGAPEPVVTCADALDMFQPNRSFGPKKGQPGAGCAAPSCHGANQRMGLWLETAEGLFLTAKDHVAHETDSGSKTGDPLAHSPRFGVNMPIIDGKRPDNSYMIYKLAMKSPNYQDDLDGRTCFTQHRVELLPGTCPEDFDAEKVRIGDAFVVGRPMPMPLPKQDGWIDARRIQAWIRSGASCP